MKAIKISAILAAKCAVLAVILVGVVLLFGVPADDKVTFWFAMTKPASLLLFWVAYKLDQVIDYFGDRWMYLKK